MIPRTVSRFSVLFHLGAAPFALGIMVMQDKYTTFLEHEIEREQNRTVVAVIKGWMSAILGLIIVCSVVAVIQL